MSYKQRRQKNRDMMFYNIQDVEMLYITLYGSMKVLEIFAFLELRTTTTKSIIKSEKESKLFKHTLIKATELTSPYNSPGD